MLLETVVEVQARLGIDDTGVGLRLLRLQDGREGAGKFKVGFGHGCWVCGGGRIRGSGCGGAGQGYREGSGSRSGWVNEEYLCYHAIARGQR